MRQVKLRSLPLPRCKYKQVYVINQIYFDFSSTEKNRRLSAGRKRKSPSAFRDSALCVAGASAPCREGGAMRRPGGTRWSEAESACPLGDRRIAARGRKRVRIPEPKRKKQRILRCFWSGGGGIRTPGTLPFNSFQDCRHRPLGHTSGYQSDFLSVSFFFSSRRKNLCWKKIK